MGSVATTHVVPRPTPTISPLYSGSDNDVAVATEASIELHSIGTESIGCPALSSAIARTISVSPTKALVSCMRARTEAACFPGPSYSNGNSISGAVAADVPGVTGTGPPLYTVSPCALISWSFRRNPSSAANIITDIERSTIESPGDMLATVSLATVLSLSRVSKTRVSAS